MKLKTLGIKVVDDTFKVSNKIWLLSHSVQSVIMSGNQCHIIAHVLFYI